MISCHKQCDGPQKDVSRHSKVNGMKILLRIFAYQTSNIKQIVIHIEIADLDRTINCIIGVKFTLMKSKQIQQRYGNMP
jgi:hypothetical protein